MVVSRSRGSALLASGSGLFPVVLPGRFCRFAGVRGLCGSACCFCVFWRPEFRRFDCFFALPPFSLRGLWVVRGLRGLRG